MAKLTEAERLQIILFDDKFRRIFWSHVDKSAGEDGCWICDCGPKNEKKYRLITIKGNDKMNAHRVSLTMKLGYFPIADALHDEKICKDNKYRCVNPKHLRDGSPKQNRIDENVAGKTLRQKKARKELFKTLVEESSKVEKMFFYEYLFNELFDKK